MPENTREHPANGNLMSVFRKHFSGASLKGESVARGDSQIVCWCRVAVIRGKAMRAVALKKDDRRLCIRSPFLEDGIEVYLADARKSSQTSPIILPLRGHKSSLLGIARLRPSEPNRRRSEGGRLHPRFSRGVSGSPSNAQRGRYVLA